MVVLASCQNCQSLCIQGASSNLFESIILNCLKKLTYNDHSSKLEKCHKYNSILVLLRILFNSTFGNEGNQEKVSIK